MITDLGQVDDITIEGDTCYLTIADQLDWSDELAHLELLEKKLMDYVLFIKSGSLVNLHPNAEGKKLVVKVVSRLEVPLDIHQRAYDQIVTGLQENKIELMWHKLK